MPSNNSSAMQPGVDAVRTADNVFFITSFISMFLTFTIGGGANVYALLKIRSCWRLNPMLCNLSIVGSIACLVSAPLQIINMLRVHLLDTQSSLVCQAAEYLWAAVEFPLCISLVTISIQRTRTVFATFGSKPSAMFEFVAIGVGWVSVIPQCILLNSIFADGSGSSTGDAGTEMTRHDCTHSGEQVEEPTLSPEPPSSDTLSRLEVQLPGWRPEYTSLVLVLGTAGLMLTAYMCSLWYLRYKAYSQPPARRPSVIHLDTLTTSQQCSTTGYLTQGCSVVQQSTVEKTTVTYMLAKQALMLHGWGRSSFATTQETASEAPAMSEEKNIPAPIPHEWDRCISIPRRRSSLDVSTIYSLRQGDVRGPAIVQNPQTIGRFSLPGCISPETEDFGSEPLTELCVKHQQWRRQHSYRSHRRPFLGDNDNLTSGRISEESANHPGSPWADKIIPPFHHSMSSDPFNDAGKGYCERSNRLSPYLDTTVFSLSSLSSDGDGESVGDLSIISVSSHKSHGRGSKSQDKIVRTLKKMCMSAVTSSGEIFYDKKSLGNTVNMAVQTCPDQGKESKQEHDRELVIDANKLSASQFTLEEPKKKRTKDGRSPRRESSRNRIVSNRSRKKHRPKTTHKELENLSPCWRTESTSGFNLPPLKHERLNASGMPFTLDQGSGASESTGCLGKISGVENNLQRSAGSIVSVNERTSSGTRSSKKLSTQTMSQVILGSITDSTEQNLCTSRILKKGSQPSEVDIFQFLAENEDSKSQMMLQCSSSNTTQVQKRHSYQNDSSIIRTLAGTPRPPQTRFSLPARIHNNSDQHSQFFPKAREGQRHHRARFTTKHDGAYHAGKKVAWLMTYYFMTMVPFAICRAVVAIHQDCSQGTDFVSYAFKALAFLCFIINPFAYVLSNKNLLNGCSRVGGMRRTVNMRGLN